MSRRGFGRLVYSLTGLTIRTRLRHVNRFGMALVMIQALIIPYLMGASPKTNSCHLSRNILQNGSAVHFAKGDDKEGTAAGDFNGGLRAFLDFIKFL